MMELVVIFYNGKDILSMTFEDAWDWAEWRDEHWPEFESFGAKLLKVW